VIFQYHEEIGYEVDLDDDELAPQDMPPEQDVADKILNRVDMLIKEGKMEDAVILIKSETKGDISNPELAERFYNLLKINEQIPDMLKHGKSYMDQLAKQNQKEKLCQVYAECISKDQGFVPNPSALLKAASCFNEAGSPKQSIDAYNRFIKANPKSPLIPKVYFLASNIFNEKLKNPKKAAGILKSLINKYPNHEIIPHVKRYLSQMRVS